MRTRFVPPDLSNATPGGIVDMCAPDIEEMNRLKKLTDYYKEALKARLDDSFAKAGGGYLIVGEQYTSTVTTAQRSNGYDFDHLLTWIYQLIERGVITNAELQQNLIEKPSTEVTTVRFEKNP